MCLLDGCWRGMHIVVEWLIVHASLEMIISFVFFYIGLLNFMILWLIRLLCASFFLVPTLLLVEWMSDESGIWGPLSTFPKEEMTFWLISPIVLPHVASPRPSYSATGSSCSNYSILVAILFYAYLSNNRLDWPEICWACCHNPYAHPHKKSWPVDARISRKNKNCCRWWRPISQKVCTGVCWNFLIMLLSSICISP